MIPAIVGNMLIGCQMGLALVMALTPKVIEADCSSLCSKVGHYCTPIHIFDRFSAILVVFISKPFLIHSFDVGHVLTLNIIGLHLS
jgi:hypothetical protein